MLVHGQYPLALSMSDCLQERKAPEENDIDHPKRNGHITDYESSSRQPLALQLWFFLKLRQRQMSTNHGRNTENESAANQA